MSDNNPGSRSPDGVVSQAMALAFMAAFNCEAEGNTDARIYHENLENVRLALEAVLSLTPDEAVRGPDPVERDLAPNQAPTPTWFPLLGTPFAIRWDMLDEEQAKANHNQTLECLAQRGGLAPDEALAVVRRRKALSMDDLQALGELMRK